MKLQKQLISKDHPDYEAIGEYIQSKESVVGIDARHTHIIIIKKLMELEKKITTLEKKLSKNKTRKKK
ncbi:MAG: hypothetical protein KF803_11895 [Cyclobacteriaceae bacterium]|nr:hypothetical protein [Cyclobacteriaceae bacterium]